MDQVGMIFNETEYIADIAAKTEKTTVKEYTRRRSGSVDDVIPEGTPVEIIEHRLSEEERICEECGAVMDEIGHDVRRTLVIVPAQVKVREERFYTYACRKCEKENDHTPMNQARTPAVIPGSFASPEAIAHIMTQKFVMHSPLYRQAQELQRGGIKLSRQTMSNWVLHASEDWLKPIYDELHRRLVKSAVLHADETTLQVLQEPGKKRRARAICGCIVQAVTRTSRSCCMNTHRTVSLRTRKSFLRDSMGISTQTDIRDTTICRQRLPWLDVWRMQDGS